MLEKINKIITYISKSTLVAILLLAPGYFSLFYGEQLLDNQDKQNIFLWLGYILMWPMLIANHILEKFNIQMEFGIALLAQTIGYSLLGVIFMKLFKTKNLSI